LGAGIPLLATGMERHLTLNQERRFSSGTLQLHYQVLKQPSLPVVGINAA